MFNTQLYIGPDGALIRKHQKIMPTVGERLVHTGGYGDTFGAFQTEFGPMSGLICGENSNPLAVFALIAEGTRIHVMSWPNHFPTSGDPLRNRVAIDSQAFAQMSKAFVISACGTVDEHMIEMLKPDPEAREIPAQSGLLRRQRDRRAQLAASSPAPWAPEEGILYADCDLELGIQMKLRHDFAGHYNRPDIFQLHINRAAPQLYRVHGVRDGVAAGRAASEALAPAPPRLTGPPLSTKANSSSSHIRQIIIMDVFEAVDSRLSCRWFLDKPVDPGIVRDLIARAARAASGGNLQPWHVYALTGAPLAEIKRQVADFIAGRDPRHDDAEYPIYPEDDVGALQGRAARSTACSFTARSASTATMPRRGSNNTSAISNSSMRRSRCSSPSTASSAPANGPISAAISTR